MSERRTKVTLYEGEKHTDAFPPENGAELVVWLGDVVRSAPEAYRNDVVVEIDSTEGYEGTSYATFEVYYYRPETDGEKQERIAGVARRADLKERRERAELARLSSKYEV